MRILTFSRMSLKHSKSETTPRSQPNIQLSPSKKKVSGRSSKDTEFSSLVMNVRFKLSVTLTRFKSSPIRFTSSSTTVWILKLPSKQEAKDLLFTASSH